MKELGVDPKLVADQLGHTLDVNQNVYTQTSVELRQAALKQLEQRLQVMSEHKRSTGRNEIMQVVQKIGAGDGDRTRDVQLGKMTVD